MKKSTINNCHFDGPVENWLTGDPNGDCFVNLDGYAVINKDKYFKEMKENEEMKKILNEIHLDTHAGLGGCKTCEKFYWEIKALLKWVSK